MRFRSLVILLFSIAAGFVLSGSAAGQATPPSQSVVSAPPSATASPDAAPSIELVQPAAETSSAPSETSTPSIELVKTQPAPETTENEPLVDPASLLPDLPKLPAAKASLIGGNIGRLDRVRDQITIQVFGGGKMKISFDPRTHIYRDGTEASLSDLRQGDRIYVDTILDGSTVFARTIRVKRSGSSGESQGIITGYRADRGELQVRDALSPQPIKIRVTPQTRVAEGDRTASNALLVPGTLVAIKFGPRQDGAEVASNVSVLARPGASFTFAGQVTAIDLRLGLLVLTSSTDHKTYEIYLDPSLGLDDNVQPSTNVTILTRFENNRYVARIVTVNSQSRQ